MNSMKKDEKQNQKYLISNNKSLNSFQEIEAKLIGDEEPIPQENIGDLILNAFKSKPNFIGQVNAKTKEQLTFQQMRENSIKCALWLKKVGVKRGDVITICTRNSSAVYAPFLASIYIGAIINPWEEKYFKDYHNGEVEIPYIAFVSPSNRQTPAMFPGEIGLWYGSLCWTHGPLLTVHAILSYVTAIKSVIYSTENFIKTIKKYKVTWVFLDSDTCNQLFPETRHSISFSDFISFLLPTLKVLLFDYWKTNIQANLFAAWLCIPIIRVYSKPETGVIFYQQEKFFINPEDNYIISHAAKNVQVAIIHENREGQMVLYKVDDFLQTGMIYCKTPYIAYTETVQPWYFTKNIGYYKDGRINIIEAFIVHESNYYKNIKTSVYYIEFFLLHHPAVLEATVITMKHPIYDRHLKAFIRIKPESKVTEQELREFVANKLSDSKFHITNFDVCFITDSFRRLPNGKIDRNAFYMQD